MTSQKFDAEIKSIFETYLKAIRKSQVADKTEHTDRGAMETLLQSLATLQNVAIKVQHEPKRNENGAPDFKVQHHASIIGYVENKKIGENLDRILKSDQIKKYQMLSRNIIVNDYLEWIWLRDGKIMARENLCFESDVENRKATLKPERIKAVSELITSFYSVAPEGVGRASELALALATRAHLLRDYLADELVRQEREQSQDRLYGLYGAFKAQVFQDLTLSEFADAFAQTLAYGLFLAALNSDKDIVTLRNAPDFVPGSFRLIRELVEFLPLLNSASYTEIKWVVEEILAIVNTMDVAAIHEDLSFHNRKATNRKIQARDEDEWRLFSKDPFIYFYEDFLGKYDAKLKKSRGVYYTPPPIVNFIVRAIDDILKDTFGIQDGLADHKRVTVLDFACGTGTFLVEVLEKIFETIGPDSGKRDLIIKNHILKNIFGFEYLIAPYTIAHLKLSQYLNERQYQLAEGERFQVYLTNTLEPIEPQKNFTLPELTRETEAAQSIKDKPILVITGNPPYSGHSKNNGINAQASIQNYKFSVETDETGQLKKVKEKNLKWLGDDYVKFIRFAQMKMDSVDEGIVGIITNHSWIDNVTFTGMRQSLEKTFDQIFVFDLHGNVKKKERTLDGLKDENVFDIEQGVAISLFIKKNGIEKGFWRQDWYGSRIEKYRKAIEGINLKAIRSNKPSLNHAQRSFLKESKSLDEIFLFYSLGVLTKRDFFVTDFDQQSLDEKFRIFTNKNNHDLMISEKYSLPLKDKDGWDLKLVRSEVKDVEIRNYNFRPFDFRKLLYHKKLIARPNVRVFSAVGSNRLGLATTRQSNAIGSPFFEAVFAVNTLTDQNYFRRGGASIFPLYLEDRKSVV